MRLEKKRILKEDGRYLLFYHSAASATATQQQAFAAVAADVEAVTVQPIAGATHGGTQNGTIEQERANV